MSTAQADAIAKGFCCNSCGAIISTTRDAPGHPQTCAVCKELAPKPKGKKAKGPWKPRKQSWPNGRVYWIVTDGKGRFLCGKSGGESKFYDKSEAQEWADKHNEGRDD